MDLPLLAAIEAGGTKFQLAVGYGSREYLRRLRVDTGDPVVTLSACADFFQQAQADYGEIVALGIAAFGPIDLNINSPSYGAILNTPKPGWSNVNLVDFFTANFDFPIAIDSDVNAAAFAEYEASTEQGNLVYVTVGTGVGVGVCLAGTTLKGQLHPELGHLSLELLPGEPAGVCAVHGNCVEGLISGVALKQRWQLDPASVAANHPLWDSTAFYLARLCSAITLAYSPYKIVVGGGVFDSGKITASLRKHFATMMAGYLPAQSFPQGIEKFIEESSFAGSSGLAGAMYMAANAYHE